MNLKDRRSRHAKLIDGAIRARTVYPDTVVGRMNWRQNKSSTDLEGHDTPRKSRHHKRGSSLFDASSDYSDLQGLTDSSLSYQENKKNMKKAMNDLRWY